MRGNNSTYFPIGEVLATATNISHERLAIVGPMIVLHFFSLNNKISRTYAVEDGCVDLTINMGVSGQYLYFHCDFITIMQCYNITMQCYNITM